jgi:hypothetical protein
MHAACPIHLTLIDEFFLIILDEDYKLHSFLQAPLCLFLRNILIIILFINTLRCMNVCKKNDLYSAIRIIR